MPPDELLCEKCGTELISIGKELIRTEIEFIPAKVRVIDYYRESYECRKCRKEKEWEFLGVKLSRTTMANWIMVASENWLRPLKNLMQRKLVEEKYLHADETPVQVLNETGRKNTSDSYMWVYSTYGVRSLYGSLIISLHEVETAPKSS